MATLNSKPMEPEYHVRTWLCNQTGILPSQYTSLAIEKLVSSTAATLEAMECNSTCLQGTDAHSALLQEVSTICLPFVLNPKILPLIEKLIHCLSCGSKLSQDFLAQITALQRGEEDYLEPPKLNLSYEARASLWATYSPSFSQELVDLVKAVGSMGLSQSELDIVISARNVPQACLEHYHLMLYAEEVLKVLFVNANASERIKQLVNSFNRQLLAAASRHKGLYTSPLQCPQFVFERWLTSYSRPAKD